MTQEVLGRILVVDDDDWIITGVRASLQPQQFEVASACNGLEGLETARAYGPDLIITDVLMPGMDGWSFVRHLRADPRFALVPVLFLTSKSTSQDRIAGFQLGADDYLGKPVNLYELPRRAKKALAQRRQLETELTVASNLVAGASGLKGTLDQVGTAALLSVLGMGRRSGILRLGRRLANEVLIYLVRGEVYRVDVEGRGRLSTEEVYRELFNSLEGAFEFVPIRLRIGNELNLSMNRLLLLGAGQGVLKTTA